MGLSPASAAMARGPCAVVSRVTRDDVARAAGTSTAVVSYVLNDGPRPVAAATRERVLQAMADLGYRPNALAAALRSQRSSLVGLLIPDLMHPFFAEIARALETAAYARGLTVLSAGSAWDYEREQRHIDELLALRVRGVVTAPVGTESVGLRAVAESGTPLVLVSGGPSDLAATSVMSDGVAAGRLATEHLFEHGHDDVVCIAGHDDNAPVVRRVEGWRQAMEARGRDSPRLVRSRYDRHSAERVAASLLHERSEPMAIMAATDELALGVLAAAARSGRVVPDECAVVGCDGISEGLLTTPVLTTVAEPIDEIAEAVLESLASDGAPPPERSLRAALRPGGSCGCGR